MARTKTKESIIKEMFKHSALTKDGKITKINKKGESKEVDVKIPLIGKIDSEIHSEKYICFMTPYEVLADKNSDYGYSVIDDTEERVADYGKSAKRILEDAIHSCNYRVYIGIDNVKQYIKEYKESHKTLGSRKVFIVNYEGDKKFGVNPDYLLSILQWCDTDYVWIIEEKHESSYILTVPESDNSDYIDWTPERIGLTLPVRI